MPFICTSSQLCQFSFTVSQNNNNGSCHMANASISPNAFKFILATVFIDTIGLGIIIPVLPELIMTLTDKGIGTAALYGGWFMVIYAGMQFIFAPVIGNLSDRFGRRPVLLLSLLGFGLDYLLMALAPSIIWLVIGRTVAGITGASYATANAAIADISPEDKRAGNFGMLGAAWGLGFIAGPAIGGLLGDLGPRTPFYAAAALAFANVSFGYFVFPETLANTKRRVFSMRRANPVGALLQMKKFPLVFGLLGAMIFFQLAHDANPSVWTYYVLEKFQWSKSQIGLSLAFVGIGIALVQGGLIRFLIPKLGERKTIYFGLSMMAIGFIGFAFSSRGWMMYAFTIPFSLGGLAGPALRSIMAGRVGESGQGELQGALSSLVGLTALFAPLIMTGLFFYYSAPDNGLYFPGAAFFAAGILVVTGLFITQRLFRLHSNQAIM